MTKLAKVAVPVAAALGLHGLLFLWPVVSPPRFTPTTVAVSLVSRPPEPAASPAPVPPRAPALAPPATPATSVPPPRPEPLPDPAPSSPADAPLLALGDQGEPLSPPPSRSDSPAPVATVTPGDANAASLADAWSAAVRGRVDAKKAYPYAARAQGLQGRVTVAFVIGSGGRVSDARVTASSGYASLDRAALAAVEAASPFPAAPESLGAGPWPFTVTLVFTLR